MGIIKRKKSLTADTPGRTEQLSGYSYVLIFLFLTIGIVAIGYFSYRTYQHNYRDQVERNISTIADQKVDALLNWRHERLGTASIFFKNPVFTSLVRDFLKDPKNADPRWRIQTWMGKIQTSFKYDQVCLFDAQGVNLLSAAANPLPASSVTLQHLPEVLRSGQVMFQDFHRDNNDQRVYLSVLVPILDEKNHNQPLAALNLRINPNTYLYPFIQKWPAESKTAETLLVRRDGNDALFLNELKFQKDAVLKLRIPLENKELPAVKALLGQEGIVEGKDYRGVPVVACLRAVPDSPWFLVARMDTAEVYAPTRERLGVIVILVIILLFGAAIGLNLLRRQQSLGFYREQSELAEALAFSNVILRTQQESAIDGILVVDEKGKILSFNQRFVDMWGIPLDVIELKSDERALQAVMDKLANPEEFIRKIKHLYEARDEISRDEVVLKNGRTFDRYSAPMLGAEGKYYGRVWYFRDITERKQAEEKLRFFALAVEKSSDAIGISTPEGKHYYQNKAFNDLFGDIGENPPATLYVDEQVGREVFRTIMEGNPWTGEVKMRGETGELSDVFLRAYAIKDDAGKILGLAGVHTDITERKQAEEMLRESTERFRLIFDNSNDGILVADTATRKFLLGNQAICRMLGYTPEELKELGVNDIHPQKDLPAVMEAFDKQLRKEIEIAPGLPVQRKDGSVFYADVNAFPLQMEDKICLVGIFRDITERKRKEETLRESNELLHLFIKQSPIYAYIKEVKPTEDRVLHASENFQHMLGKPGQNIVGRTMDELFPAEFAAKITADDWDVITKGEVLRLEEELNGRIYTSIKFPIVQAGRTLLAGYTIDITERRQAEKERNSLREQLIRSEKLAAVGELIAGVVHEINNPLTGMKGLSELLMKETQDEEKKKDLMFIHQSSERIEKIVKNLQRFARREEPTRKDVNINELIDVVISIRNYEMEARSVKVERDYLPDLPLVMADPSQLEQVFLNLITNAEYAIHDHQQKAGTLTIATSVVPDNSGGETVVIEFSDTGTGIPIDVLPKLFNPFFTTKGVGKGTGLGLSTSYGIIKGHGGEIYAGNRAEGGAVFTIKLPVQRRC